MGKLNDRVALITGSDSGIAACERRGVRPRGSEPRRQLPARRGGANRTKDELEAQGQRAIIVQADHGYEDQVEKLFDAAFDAFGTLDHQPVVAIRLPT